MSLVVHAKYESYKDSDIQWLRDIPEDWDIHRFRFLCSIGTGERNTEDKQEEGRYPFFVRSQTPEQIGSYSYDGEAILTAGDGAGVGRVYHYVNGKFDFHQRVYKFSDFREVAGRYLYYYLSANFANVALLGTAKSTIDSLRLPLIQDFPVAFPKDETAQIDIVNFLDEKCSKLDEAVRIKEEQITLLRERRQILIQRAVTRGLNPDATMKDSGIDWIGKIPAHWEVERNFVLFREVKAPGHADLPVLSVSIHSGVSSEELSDDENIRSIIKIEDRTSYKEVLKGDIAYNMMRAWQGGIGAVAVHGMVSPAYVVARPTAEMTADYFELLYRTPAFIAQMDAGSKGITDFRKRLYWDDFRDLLTLIPPITEQNAVVAQAKATDDKIENAISLKQLQIDKLKEYKATLINAAVTGKIRVA